MRTLQSEFPEYGPLDITLPPGFFDSCWHNDAMPRFCRELPNGVILSLWVDFEDMGRSECYGKRFALTSEQDGAEPLELVESDDYEDILQYLQAIGLVP